MSVPHLRLLPRNRTPIPSMKTISLSFVSFLLLLLHGAAAAPAEEWGYVEVRPKAHMFWWLYRSPNRVDNASNPWPTILWLQGGPGASGVGVGNFEEVGPLDLNLKPRNSTWLQKADLLFVDNPVGTGYSYVEEDDLFVTTDEAAAEDTTALLKELYNKNQSLQQSPLFVVAESYGGKFAVTLGLAVVKAVQAGELKLELGGIALGDSWISPEDFVLSWGPLLRDVSRLDINGAAEANSLAEKIREEIAEGRYADATNTWGELEGVIGELSNNVDIYNFMLDSSMDELSATAATAPLGLSSTTAAMFMKRYSGYLGSKLAVAGAVSSSDDDLGTLMNGVIRKKLKIIPDNISWGGQSDQVFNALSSDFMKPRINEVDELLSLGVNVTIYNGQLDVICATKGTESWLQKLRWEGLKNFTDSLRVPLYCDSDMGAGTRAFFKSYLNLQFYWILGSGHFVPAEQPCIALKMVGDITHSPAPPTAKKAIL